MRKVLFFAAALALAGVVNPASADDARLGCPADPQAISIPAATLRVQIEDMGYDVRRLKARPGCFEAYLVNRENGGTVEAIYSAATGELLRARLASEGPKGNAAH